MPAGSRRHFIPPGLQRTANFLNLRFRSPAIAFPALLAFPFPVAGHPLVARNAERRAGDRGPGKRNYPDLL